MKLASVALAAALALAALPASAADPVKIGLITTLSGPGAGLGNDVRDGFNLAVTMQGGTLGGIPVQVVVEDDTLKPEVAAEIAARMVERDDIKIMTGIIFSNVAMAVVPKVLEEDVFYLSANAGPSQLAGAGCHPHYFNVAYQNDNMHEATGQYVNDQGFKSVFLLAPNYAAGKDALTGFKRYFKGEVVGELYTQLGQTDYAAELAQVRDAKPDAVYFFLPGGMGVAFVKQYAQAGLSGTIPMFGPAFSFDQDVLPAIGDAALGVKNGSTWSKDLDNAANKEFVAAFQAAYGRLPSLYAAQGYDTARLLASALDAVEGALDDEDAFAAALKAAKFDTVRGKFRFGNNNHPIQDIYVREVVKEGDVLTNKIVGVAFTDHQDAYAAQCDMK